MKDSPLRCIGFIMDGNRRWAKDQGLTSTYKGHQRGFEVFEESIAWVREHHIPHVVYYAFSSENWKRSEPEVSYLMDLFREALGRIETLLEAKSSDGTTINVRIIGRREDFSPDLQAQMNELEQKNARFPNPTSTIWMAFSYGGRAEIMEAVNIAVGAGRPIDEATFESYLWTADLPDPDIIVRTSGEQRLSNFLTWRSVYSELYFIAKHWPALTKADFDDILEEYGKRNRRQGA